MNSKPCEFCGTAFTPRRWDQKFHSRECHDQWFAEERRRALAAYRRQQAMARSVSFFDTDLNDSTRINTERRRA